MKGSIVLFGFCLILGETYASGIKHRTVKTNTGAVRGIRDRTLLNKIDYYSFKGIPYAKAPIGDLRFKVCSMEIRWIKWNFVIYCLNYAVLFRKRLPNQSILGHLKLSMHSNMAILAFVRIISLSLTIFHRAKTAFFWMFSFQVNGDDQNNYGFYLIIFVFHLCTLDSIEFHFNLSYLLLILSWIWTGKTWHQTGCHGVHSWRRIFRLVWQWRFVWARFLDRTRCHFGYAQLSAWSFGISVIWYTGIFRQYGPEGSTAGIEMGAWKYRAILWW